jgi:transcription elongation factor Elf1
MPYDPHGQDDDDDKDQAGEALGSRRRFNDFDCPDCNANNPYDDAFGDGDEIRCYYCGQEFRVQVSDEGRLRLREA